MLAQGVLKHDAVFTFEVFPPSPPSPIMTMESPILISACCTVQSGRLARKTSVAPKACFAKSISLATPVTTIYELTVWCPSGMYFT